MKCVVPSCPYDEESTTLQFFSVPPSCSSSFKKWQAHFFLSGLRYEKICQLHFVDSDFRKNVRQELKPKAVPKLNIPTEGPKLTASAVNACCVAKCPTNTRKQSLTFPTKKPYVLKKWKAALSMESTASTTNLRVCPLHFEPRDFRTVTSLYLKPNAVPSKKLAKLKTEPKRKRLPPEERPVHKSNRCCFVPGCSHRACEGISLHNFPKPSDRRYGRWVEAIRSPREPTKNSSVCSKHFVKTDYFPGGKMLNRNAIPSQNLPDGGTFSGSVLIVQPNFQAEVENDFAAAVKVEDPLDID
ncbi:uncharacterized protein LOC6050187 [Culex quinquefasciatus]|uniref:uncharacterized protein LOC6050187 n=1 Tax=Culex quinquefasciatus TaxID=7176 RepID=UPI0018E2E604|nr:uncharacterized protein LOC6050187 [Culex quinquefasciatus]